jgi:rod shape determining protein RodA
MRIPSAWYKFDLVLFGLLILLCLTGLTLIYSASHYQSGLAGLVFKQAMSMGIGLLILSFFYIIDYQGLVKTAYPLFGLIIIILLMLIFFGIESGGSQRWFDLGFFHLQPSEFAKLILIFVITRYALDHDRELKTFKGILTPLLLTAVLMAVILKQPDLGTALVLFPITFVILFVAGAKLWHLLSVSAVMLASTPLVWNFLLKDYQRRRWLSFIDPESDLLGAGYNAIQSKIAIGSGGFWGKGFLQGTQSQLNFVPMHHTDFVFSVLAEEWGFLGCLIVMGLYVFCFCVP